MAEIIATDSQRVERDRCPEIDDAKRAAEERLGRHGIRDPICAQLARRFPADA